MRIEKDGMEWEGFVGKRVVVKVPSGGGAVRVCETSDVVMPSGH